MQLFFHNDIIRDKVVLEPEESRHLTKVLRKSPGDQVFVTNGRGSLFTCQISKTDPKKTELTVISETKDPSDQFHIHLAIAPTKNADRMEWMLEKITEIGFHEVTLLKTSNSERNFLKPDRLEKKVIAACKQSLKTYFPTINPTVTFDDFIHNPSFQDFHRFIAYVDENNQQHLFDIAEKEKSYLILIGPEGDFSPEEIQKAFQAGFKACSLGKSRLRTETAGLVAVHSLQLVNSR